MVSPIGGDNPWLRFIIRVASPGIAGDDDEARLEAAFEATLLAG
jgi:hypothetical protein